MKRIAVLVSGNGTTLQALIDAGIGITLVISSKKDVPALKRAEEHNIESTVIEWADYRNSPTTNLGIPRELFSREVLNALKRRKIEFIVYAGFNVVLSDVVCSAFPESMINIHPSLIPSFCGEGFYGLKVHEAALARGVKLTGATVHYVTSECDGGPIIAQKAVQVMEGDTPESLQQRVMETERELYPKIVKQLTGD